MLKTFLKSKMHCLLDFVSYDSAQYKNDTTNKVKAMEAECGMKGLRVYHSLDTEEVLPIFQDKCARVHCLKMLKNPT